MANDHNGGVGDAGPIMETELVMATVAANIVEVVILRRKGTLTEYLLLRRSDDERVYPGIWQIVSGKIREGETAVAAARREMREETGLQSINFWTLPFVNGHFNTGLDTVILTPMFVAETVPLAEPTLSREHGSWKWSSPEEAKRLLLWPGSHRALEVCESYIVQRPDVADRLRLE